MLKGSQEAYYNHLVIFVYIWLIVVNLFWLAFLIQSIHALRKFEYLPEDLEISSAPKVSIIVPARNESRILPQSLKSFLSLDYPDFEIILIDDHSEDDTYAIASRIAVEDPRLKVIRSEELPGDWRGKSWACQQGAAHAQGNWLLLTDADVILDPGVLRHAIATAQKRKIDLLSILPHIECGTFWSRSILPAFAVILNMIRPVHKSNDPKSNTALAAGGFILVKTLLFRHEGGYHLVRESMAEDVRIAELFKSKGYTIKTFLTRNRLVRTQMYDRFAEVWDGLSRHAFEGSGYSPLKMSGAVLGAYSLIVAPFLLGIISIIAGFWKIALFCAFPLLVMLGIQASANRHFRIPQYYFFSFPLATALYGLMMMNSMISYYFRGGNHWKGRRYRKESTT